MRMFSTRNSLLEVWPTNRGDSYASRDEVTYSLDVEPVLTGENIEHLTEKILDEYEICLE